MFEFRIYYDEQGKVLCYTCEDLPGDNYIVIDAHTYAVGNPYIRIIDGKIVSQSMLIVTAKMKQSTKGVKCAPEDICIITDEEPNVCWEIETHEFRNY